MYVHAAANSTATASANAQQEEATMNTEIVTTTTAPVTPLSENPKQPQQRQTAKEIIAANVKSLIEQMEAGHSDALTAYLDAMSRFHNYSFGNILEIARQRPTATRVSWPLRMEPAWT
jgi:hypothetical protein